MKLAQNLVGPGGSDAVEEARAPQTRSRIFERQLGVGPPVLDEVNCQGQYLPDRQLERDLAVLGCPRLGRPQASSIITVAHSRSNLPSAFTGRLALATPCWPMALTTKARE